MENKMKTVQDLIDFLKTQKSDMPVQVVYDGFEQHLFIYEFKDRLCISSDNYDPDFKDPKILFQSLKK